MNATKTAAEIANAYALIEQGKTALGGAVESVWADTCLYVKEAINGTGETAAKAVTDRMAQTLEPEIEKATGKKVKPGAYRSTKSVISKAITKGVALFNPDGTVRGKSAVEKDCKEEKTPEEKVQWHLSQLVTLLSEGATLTADARAALVTVNALAK